MLKYCSQLQNVGNVHAWKRNYEILTKCYIVQCKRQWYLSLLTHIELIDMLREEKGVRHKGNRESIVCYLSYSSCKKRKYLKEK